ncbi:hypothetical protein ACLOJK_025516, partial [Asimina triloba]
SVLPPTAIFLPLRCRRSEGTRKRTIRFQFLHSSTPQNLLFLRKTTHSRLMSLLEIITKAKSEQPTIPKTLADHPIILNPDPIFPLLKSDSNPAPTNVVNPITGWQISAVDSSVIESNSSFFKKLQRKLKKPKILTQDEFLKSLNSFLEQTMKGIGLSVSVATADPDYTRLAIEKMGFAISRDVAGLIAEACLVLGLWELLDALIAQGLIRGLSTSSVVLVEGLIRKSRADLLCRYIRAASDIQSSELLLILKYFLSPPNESRLSLVSVTKEWEKQAMLSIDRASDQNLDEMKSRRARQAAILLMMAHDGFSANELCLHYLFASRNVHGLPLSWAVARLDGLEVVRLVKYLGKWLRKYEKFPEASPCPEAATWGLEACKWVPSIEVIVVCLGSVLDEHLLYLTLSSELHEELRSIGELARLFTAEAGLCCSLASVIESMRKDAGIHGGGEIGEV